MTWVLYLLGIALAFAAGWWLRGLRDEDRAAIAAIEKIKARREAPRPHPKDFPYP